MVEPATFVKKPVAVKAMQFTDNTSEAHALYLWIEENTLGSFEPLVVLDGDEPPPESGVSIHPETGQLLIATREGLMSASLGDWIIQGVKGEFYPCKPDIFEQTYTRLV